MYHAVVLFIILQVFEFKYLLLTPTPSPTFSAREALSSKHPLMKLRPLSKSSSATKAKARSFSGTSTVILPSYQFSICLSSVSLS